jgi:hypothetical protein
MAASRSLISHGATCIIFYRGHRVRESLLQYNFLAQSICVLPLLSFEGHNYTINRVLL